MTIPVSHKSKIDWLGIALSFIFFLALAIVTYYFTNERFLIEGSRELIGVINNEFFFFLHPERVLFMVSQVFALIGLKLGASLNVLMYLYSFNLFFTTLLIYLVFFLMKDYYAGIYLCSFNLIAIGGNFFIYPFSEHVYALIFSYLLFKIFTVYPQNKKLLVLIVPLIALIISIHPDTIFYIAFLLVLLNSGLKEKLLLLMFSGIVLVATLVYTEITIESRLSSISLSLIPQRLGQFLIHYPDVVLLFVITIVVVLKSNKRTVLLPIFVISVIPFLLYFQIPSYYFMLPCGLCILLLATNSKMKTNFAVIGVVALLYAYNINRVNNFGQKYRDIYHHVTEVIDVGNQLGGSKFILLKGEKTAHYFDNQLDYNFGEGIKHASLLFSSRNDKSQTVVVESFDFCIDAFSNSDSEKVNSSEKEIINFIENLFDQNKSNNLYPDFQHNYEYSKYFFTNKGVNAKYFEVDPSDNYKILEF